MGAQRTSNKDLLEAINAQTESINALVNALTSQTAAPAAAAPATPAVEVAEPEASPPTANDPIRVDKGYRDHMVRKVSALVGSDGEPRVLYARRNGKGEIKLAFRKQSMWDSLRDKGFIAALEIVSA